jgi:hypothetical protein
MYRRKRDIVFPPPSLSPSDRQMSGVTNLMQKEDLPVSGP